ncbi:hypothetical protein A2Y83_04665 [Candidatus Falkowbacteria bacterium RBG_13_39_14]|uniref:Uncharacterized protein n=1 Tax=Candidatus Falkowbacteria bacterium RBG_13_39_14 TaxID=1797985 RepID=A0A1F5S6H6_9BACT|nr:MAG: hypothetical protein A2Y83_04665 [Candidatus Falkowbacteria bacterium RBG_13_39_14]
MPRSYHSPFTSGKEEKNENKKNLLQKYLVKPELLNKYTITEVVCLHFDSDGSDGDILILEKRKTTAELMEKFRKLQKQYQDADENDNWPPEGLPREDMVESQIPKETILYHIYFLGYCKDAPTRKEEFFKFFDGDIEKDYFFFPFLW